MAKKQSKGEDLTKYLLKEPFKVPIADSSDTSYLDGINGDSGAPKIATLPKMKYRVIPQEQFLREYHASSHAIFIRPDWEDTPVVKKYVGANGEEMEYNSVYRMQRKSVNLQQTITTKRLLALTGNKTVLEDAETYPTDRNRLTLAEFKNLWKINNMEIAKEGAIESILMTGDGAVYMAVVDGEIHHRVFSFKNGDVLIPQRDAFGNIESISRMYSVVDEEGKSLAMLDIYGKDDVKIYKGDGGATGWELFDTIEHNMGIIPVAYGRMDGACWSPVQPLIDDYEFLCSNLSENNKRASFQMLFVSTDGDLDIQADGAGTPILKGNAETKANWLGKADVSNGFEIELEQLEKNIMQGAGVVKPLSKSSGDLPTGSMKLLYAPVIEVGMRDAKKLDPFIDQMVRIFKKCVGILTKRVSDFEALRVVARIDIYTPIDESSVNNDVIQAYNAGVISRETATQECPFSAADENIRIKKEEQMEKELEAKLVEKGITEESINVIK